MYRRQGPLQDCWSHINVEKWTEIHGAPTPHHFIDAQVEKQRLKDLAVCDVSVLPKIGLKGPGAARWLVEQGICIPQTTYEWHYLGERALIVRTDRNEFILEESPSGQSVLRLSEKLAIGVAEVYPVERQDAGFLLGGKRAIEVLSQTCGFNFNPFPTHLVMTRAAGVSCAILYLNVSSLPAFRVWCARSYGIYLWENLAKIVRELNGAVVGFAAYRSLLDDHASV